MGNISDNYPVGMCDCDRIGLNGQCNEDCPLLKSEEMIRYDEECYSWHDYSVLKEKELIRNRSSNMSSIKFLEI